MAGEGSAETGETRVESTAPAEASSPSSEQAAAGALEAGGGEVQRGTKVRLTQHREATDPQAKLVEADRSAAEALRTGLETMKAELNTALKAFKKVVEAKESRTRRNQVYSAIEKKDDQGKTQAERIEGEIQADFDRIDGLLKEGKYKEARTVLKEIQDKVFAFLDGICDKNQAGERIVLSSATRDALKTLREVAARWKEAELPELFVARTRTLSELADAAAQGAMASQPPRESAPPATPEAPASDTPAEQAPGMAEAQAVFAALPQRDPFTATLTEIQSALDHFDYAINWPGSWDYEKQQAAIQGLRSDVGAKATELSTAVETLRTTLSEGRYPEAVSQYAALKQNLVDWLAQFKATLKSHPTFPGKEPLVQAVESVSTQVLPAFLAPFDRAIENLQSAMTAPAITPATAASEAASNPPEVATPAPVEKTEAEKHAEWLKSVEDQLVEGIALIREGNATKNKSERMGKLVGGGFKILGALLSLWTNWNLDDFGNIVGKVFSGALGEEPSSPSEDLFKDPEKLLFAIGLKPKDATIFVTLTMEELYAFYLNPDGKHPEFRPAEIKALKALYTDQRTIYDGVMQDIFEDHGGEAFAKDPEKKKKSVLTFFFQAMKDTKNWSIKSSAQANP